ncbi:DUF3322 domain-containing protein [Herbidospora daliensis]|uniref:DUF3322 domain-containing protein n=1 Tax=Herbidospora daliensis TaxID=295585 RepID=UPI00078097E2|nr:DUF3322 domain-containing protein [Herbidospora daliensis]
MDLLIGLGLLLVGYLAGRARSWRRELTLAVGEDPFAVDLDHSDDPTADELAADLADAQQRIGDLEKQIAGTAEARVNEFGREVDVPARLCLRAREECLRETARADQANRQLAELTNRGYR